MNCYEVAAEDKRVHRNAKGQCVCLGGHLRTIIKTESGKVMTLKMVADAVGLCVSTMCEIETGRTIPSLPVALRLAKFYRVNVEDLWPPARNSQWFP